VRDLFFGQIGRLRKPLIVSTLILMSTGMAIAGFQRPAIDGPIPDVVKSACTAEKSPTIKAIVKAGVLNWALGISHPFAYRQADGQYTGIEVDNANELAHFLGVKVSIADYDYNLLPTALAAGQADIIGAQLYITDARKKVIDFSDPYFMAGQVFYVLKDSKWKTISDLNSTENRYVQDQGAGQIELATKKIPLAPQQLVQKRGQILIGYDFMKTNQADSTMTDGFLFGVLQSRFPDLVAIGNNGRIAKPPVQTADMIEPFQIGFGVRKNDPAFRECVNAYVGELLSSGRMQQRIDYWSNFLSENL